MIEPIILITFLMFSLIPDVLQFENDHSLKVSITMGFRYMDTFIKIILILILIAKS